MRPLFIGGPARSGTTALTDYLNLHEEILVCRERYKYVPRQVDPTFFTFARILDYEPQQKSGETNVPWEHHAELLATKDPERLKWIGDKFPGYVKMLREVSDNNPGAHFIATYRPIEEVAESFEARSRNLEDRWLGGKDGFSLGVENWNLAMRGVCEFLRSTASSPILIISYHDFFYRNESCIPLISRFLDLEFDNSLRRAWRELSRRFEDSRRRKEPLTEEQMEFIEQHKDHDAERRVLERIEQQWNKLKSRGQTSGKQSEKRELPAAFVRELKTVSEKEERITNLRKRIEELEKALGEERQKATSLETRRQNLTGQNAAIAERLVRMDAQMSRVKASRSWRLLESINRLRARILGT